MTAVQSNLSAPKYGYDFVVAVTQESINSNMKEYLHNLTEPEVIMCYIVDKNNTPQLIDYNELVKQAKGSDPFSIPDGATGENQDVQNLNDVFFWYAFKAKLGIPPGYGPAAAGLKPLPDIVNLNDDVRSVGFTMMCSEFQVVELNYTRRATTYLNKTQPAGDAWLFKSKVDLSLADVKDNKQLPANIKKAIVNLGPNAFSIQQLFFDLDNAALESQPEISGVAEGTPVSTALQTVFLGAYFGQMKKNGQPILNYAVKHSKPTGATSSLTLTNLDMEVNPYLNGTQRIPNPTIEQTQAMTLCYLCATDHHTLPTPTEFGWNWLDTSELGNADGVLAINRNTFRDYLQAQLMPFVSRYCFKPYVKVEKGLEVSYSYNLTAGWGTPTIQKMDKGDEVLVMNFENTASDQAGYHGWEGSMTIRNAYNLQLHFNEDTIIIRQQMVVFVDVTDPFDTSGAVVDKTIVDTYTLSIDDEGKIATTRATKTVDHSQKLDFYAISGLKDMGEDINRQAANLANNYLESIPISMIENFIFPGGSTFTYKDVKFSDNQDLIAHITYTQPS